MREVLVLSLMACSACRPHVRLEAPPAGAPAQARLEAYERHRPAAEAATVLVSSSGRAVAKTTDFLVLGDGRRVYHAEDLVPVVSQGSATAGAGRRSEEAATKAKVWLGIGWAAVLAGMAMSTVAIAPSDSDGSGPMFMVGLATTFGGLGIGSLAHLKYGPIADDERVSAFTTYEKDLRTRLDVCVEGTRILDCGMARPAAAPAAPDPARTSPR